MPERDPNHPILVRPHFGRVTVTLEGETMADSENVQTLYECGHEPVHYFPRTDVDMSKLEPTDKRTHCPYKGEARHWTACADDAVAKNAAWSYEQPFPAASAVAGYLAFYPDKAEISET